MFEFDIFSPIIQVAWGKGLKVACFCCYNGFISLNLELLDLETSDKSHKQ